MIQIVSDWRPLWPWVRKGLDEIHARTQPTWIAEDVYAELKSGSAALLTINGDAGFCIVKRLVDYDGPSLFLWAMWGPNELATLYDEIMASLDGFARQAECKRIRMMSPRKGWRRVDGWRERDTVFERPL